MGKHQVLCKVCGEPGGRIRTWPVYRLGEPVVLCDGCQLVRCDNPYYLDPSPEAAVQAYTGDQGAMRPAKKGVILDTNYRSEGLWR